MSTDRIYVKPTTDPGPRLPHDPAQRIPQEGRFVERTTYVRRLLDSGDLVEAKPPTTSKASPKRASSTATAEE